MATPKMREDRLTHSPSTAVPSSIALAALRSPIRQYYKAQARFCFFDTATQPLYQINPISYVESPVGSDMWRSCLLYTFIRRLTRVRLGIYFFLLFFMQSLREKGLSLSFSLGLMLSLLYNYFYSVILYQE